MTNPLITIIVPVFNMEKYLDQTVGSLLSQSLKNIEIIYVDDASTDGSLALLREWENKDSRIVVHHFDENKSAWVARRWGVEKARGEYIMFADADDVLLPSACKELYAEMRKNPVDMLHFQSEVVNVNNLAEERIQFMENFLKPYIGRLEGSDILDGCFLDVKYRFNLWNKIYSAKLCKKAFSGQKDVYLPKGQDKLAYFLIAYYAKSYRGIDSKKYYRYFFGRGGTGIADLTVPQFERNCALAYVADELHEFLSNRSEVDENAERYQKIENRFRRELLADCMNKWCNNISLEKRQECFDLCLKYWNPSEVIAYIAKKEHSNAYEVAKQLIKAESLQFPRRKIQTIATYSHSLLNGGQQRVFCELANLWDSMGYTVVLLTDKGPDPNDYDLSPGIERIIVPDYSLTTYENYYSRAVAFFNIITEKNIDLVVYHPWVMKFMLWDELVVKSAGAAFLAHCHNMFSLGIFSHWTSYRNITAPYLLADAVVVLSNVDKCFWRYFNGNVHDVYNPFMDDVESWKVSSCKGHDILWLGRLSDEKSPFDVPRIMKEVIESVPDAKLHIVGSSKISGYEDALQNYINDMGLGESITLHGFHKDVQPFYQSADVFLMTSEYEGFPLTLQEALVAGLPVVMYELPFLELVKENPGILSVPQHNTKEAARKIIDLLLDDRKRQATGASSRAFIEKALKYDFSGKWKDIFESIENGYHENVSYDERLMMEMIAAHHDHGVKKACIPTTDPYSNRKTVKVGVFLAKTIDSYRENGIKKTFINVLGELTHKIRHR